MFSICVTPKCCLGSSCAVRYIYAEQFSSVKMCVTLVRVYGLRKGNHFINLVQFFYLWGRLKWNMYSNNVCIKDDLKGSIQSGALSSDGMIFNYSKTLSLGHCA